VLFRSPMDVELSLLKQRLMLHLPSGPAPDLVTLTRLAYETILADLEQMITLTVSTASSDYAVLTGIQVHGPGGKEFVWPGTLYVVIAGRKQNLVLG
jgi:hypothetical protein